MSKIASKNQIWYLVSETTTETAEAASSGSEAVAVIEGGEMTISQENLERAVVTSSLGKAKGLGGIKTFSGNVSLECKSGDTAGDAPEYGPMLKTAFAERQNTTTVTSRSGTNTTTNILIETADIGKFAVNDTILIKESGAYWTSPITAVDATGGSENITIKYAASGIFSSGVDIEQFTNYQPIDTGHDTVSIYREHTGESGTATDEITGARMTSMALSGFSTGALPQFDFAFQGLNGQRTLATNGLTESYDGSQPPVALGAFVRVNGSDLCFNEFGFSMEDAVSAITCVGEDTGMVGQKITDRTFSMTLNPYKEDDSLTLYNLAQDRTTFEVFIAAYVPSTTTGEYSNICAFHFPTCVITEHAQGDQNSTVTEAFSIQPFTTDGSSEMIMTFI